MIDGYGTGHVLGALIAGLAGGWIAHRWVTQRLMRAFDRLLDDPTKLPDAELRRLVRTAFAQVQGKEGDR